MTEFSIQQPQRTRQIGTFEFDSTRFVIGMENSVIPNYRPIRAPKR